jgi:hypothetical protein
LKISYLFEFADREPIRYELTLDGDSFLLEAPATDRLPDWTALEFEQCPNCPLSSSQHSHCPVAKNLVPIITDWSDVISFDEVRLTVTNPDRTVTADTTAQKGLSSLLGLVMATSACPHTTFFRPMAYFHLPLANQEETLIRATSSFLLVQYFLSQGGGEHNLNLDELAKVYERIRVVNESLCKRIQSLNTRDASANAMVILHLLSCVMPWSFDQSLEQVRNLFQPVIAMLEEPTP